MPSIDDCISGRSLLSCLLLLCLRFLSSHDRCRLAVVCRTDNLAIPADLLFTLAAPSCLCLPAASIAHPSPIRLRLASTFRVLVHRSLAGFSASLGPICQSDPDERTLSSVVTLTWYIPRRFAGALVDFCWVVPCRYLLHDRREFGNGSSSRQHGAVKHVVLSQRYTKQA
ncbi:unnamed protein product [Protopolystoma xenopodis]|uniref:Secreted protein n=1 Tax=Protopolystoma xenopodis TaxID=117903 RepID=A0A448XJL2_9PLAT|nr:unnamed protein product [Protopolystoma xenopodis]